jgi:hypothetical protein
MSYNTEHMVFIRIFLLNFKHHASTKKLLTTIYNTHDSFLQHLWQFKATSSVFNNLKHVVRCRHIISTHKTIQHVAEAVWNVQRNQLILIQNCEDKSDTSVILWTVSLTCCMLSSVLNICVKSHVSNTEMAARFDVLTVMLLMLEVLQDVTQCHWVSSSQCF